MDAAGQVLLEKRSDCGLWGLLGGRVEPGESIHQTARREVKEESGLEIEILSLIGVYSEPGGRLVTYPGELHPVHLIDIILSARITGGTLRCSLESEELRFFPKETFPAEIAPPAVAPLRDFCLGRMGIID